jgi:hypothetical protein
MRSRGARLTFAALAWLAIAAGAYFVVQSERQTWFQRGALRAFDLRAREVTDALAEARSGQQAYVAAGQGVPFWSAKVAAVVESVNRSVAALRTSTTNSQTVAALDAAATAIGEFAAVDQRARDYLASGEQLMAADVVFSAGGEAAAAAARRVETARVTEYQAFDAALAARLKREALAAAGVAGLLALVVALLVPRPRVELMGDTTAPATEAADAGELMLRSRDSVAPARDSRAATDAGLELEGAAPSARPVSPVLKAAAQICTDLGRAGSLDELTRVLGSVAGVLDASGVVLWLGDPAGGELRPVVAHGYSLRALARMPAVLKSADNAAATAYRTAAVQIVRSRPGTAGAIVAPLLSAQGCVGVLSAEIQGGGEASESVQTLAVLFAAQLASVFDTSSGAETRQAPV